MFLLVYSGFFFSCRRVFFKYMHRSHSRIPRSLLRKCTCLLTRVRITEWASRRDEAHAQQLISRCVGLFCVNVRLFWHVYASQNRLRVCDLAHAQQLAFGCLFGRSLVSGFLSHRNALQYTAKCHNTPQHNTTHCKTLQRTATRCNTLQHAATHWNTLELTHCNTLQHAATHCNTLQHTDLESCDTG